MSLSRFPPSYESAATVHKATAIHPNIFLLLHMPHMPTKFRGTQKINAGHSRHTHQYNQPQHKNPDQQDEVIRSMTPKPLISPAYLTATLSSDELLGGLAERVEGYGPLDSFSVPCSMLVVNVSDIVI
jgi:hypothetical protein